MLDVSGRKEFPHTVNVKLREWEARHAADRKTRASLDGKNAITGK